MDTLFVLNAQVCILTFHRSIYTVTERRRLTVISRHYLVRMYKLFITLVKCNIQYFWQAKNFFYIMISLFLMSRNNISYQNICQLTLTYKVYPLFMDYRQYVILNYHNFFWINSDWSSLWINIGVFVVWSWMHDFWILVQQLIISFPNLWLMLLNRFTNIWISYRLYC